MDFMDLMDTMDEMDEMDGMSLSPRFKSGLMEEAVSIAP